MRRLLCGFVLVSGCFSPDASDVGDTTGTQSGDEGTGGSDGEATLDGSGSNPDPSDGGDVAGDDGTNGSEGVDDPPDIEIEVSADDIDTAGRLTIEATASDAQGIERVEFYLGDQRISTDENAPYEFGLLVTSLQNGTLEFSARAFDTAGQEGISDTVPVNVDIEGGRILRDDDMGRTAFVDVTWPRPIVANDQSIIVGVSRTFSDESIDTAAHLRRYEPGLGGLQWDSSDISSLASGEPGHAVVGRPALRSGGAEVVVGGVIAESTVFRASALTGTFSDAPLSLPGERSLGSVVVDRNGVLYVAGPGTVISRFDADLNPMEPLPLGESFGDGSGLWDLQLDADDNLIVDLVVCDGDECSLLTTRASTDGEVAWTRGLPFPADGLSDFALSAGATGVGGARVASAVVHASGIAFVVRDIGTGETLQAGEIELDQPVHPNGVVVDPQGQLVISGLTSTDDLETVGAWIGRFTPQGEEIWQRGLDFGGDNIAYSLAHDARGRVVVTGVANAEIGAVPSAAFAFTVGDAWIAYLEP